MDKLVIVSQLKRRLFPGFSVTEEAQVLSSEEKQDFHNNTSSGKIKNKVYFRNHNC